MATMTRSERRSNRRAIRQTLRMANRRKRTPGVQINLGLPISLTLLFTVLKLTGPLSWGWLWVFAPLWLAALFVLAVWLTALHAARVRRPPQL
jgi:Flp pilus assembly protein TadB